MTLHLRPLPSRPVRIDTPIDRNKWKEVHADLRRSIDKPKRRRKYPITYSHS